MTILFAGGEPEDFTAVGSVSSTTSSTFYRSAYARMAITVNAGTWPANYITAAFSASAIVSVTARVYFGTNSTAGNPWFALSSGGVSSSRLRLKMTGTSPTTIILESYNGTTATTLATSTLTVAAGTLYRLDVVVDYGASGRVRVYIDQTLYIDTGTMDVTAAGSTTLNQMHLGTARTSAAETYWSEIVAADEDTRPLSLKTLVLNGAGDTSAWTGAYTDVDETTASDTDVLSSGTAAQVTNMECTGMPAGSNLAVRAVKVVASALRGASGPQKMQLGVKSGSTSDYSADLTLGTGYANVSNTWTVNPATSAAFTGAEIDSLKLAVKSIA